MWKLMKAIKGCKRIQSCFTFAADPDFLKNDIRVKPDLDAHGALGDAGWYCVRSILWAADYELPKTVIALHGPVLNEVGVILSCGASLHWDDGKIATFHCSFLSNLTMDITAIGSKGTLHVHDFVVPFQENEASFSAGSESWFNELVSAWVPPPSKHTITTDLAQEVLMVSEFAGLVETIKVKGLKPGNKWPTISRKTQLVIDAVKASIERGFEPIEVGN
uniref:GFO/IDH/MocA-like oxidoreductase domain-containing protein n=1 Tax=Fagus sylvatica TaxID=28930 RepID=A0A2N9H085_FAGSY